MFDFTTVRTGIKEWILAATSLVGIMADQNAPKPNGPHFIYRITSIMQIGFDYLSAPNATGFATLYGSRDFTCQIQGFGADILSKTEVLRTSTQIPVIWSALSGRKIVVFDQGAVEDITGLDGTEFEERSSLDVFMRTEMVLTGVDVGLIEIVNGVATYKNPGSNNLVRNLAVS